MLLLIKNNQYIYNDFVFLSDSIFPTKAEKEQIKKFKCGNCRKPFKFKSILLLHSMKCKEISPEIKENYVMDEETDNIANDRKNDGHIAHEDAFNNQENKDLKYITIAKMLKTSALKRS